jgi:hypothetical protein
MILLSNGSVCIDLNFESRFDNKVIDNVTVYCFRFVSAWRCTAVKSETFNSGTKIKGFTIEGVDLTNCSGKKDLKDLNPLLLSLDHLRLQFT